MEQLKDEQLIKNYLNGDGESLEFLIQRYLKLIYSFIAHSLRDKDEAEDLTQQVFLKVWENLGKFDLDRSFKTWIYKIARNTIIDFLRKKKFVVYPSMVNQDDETINYFDTVADPGPSALDELKNQELKAVLDKGLLKLPVDDRLLIILYYSQKITFREIAEMLDEPLDTIKSRHRRAIIKLRKIFNIKNSNFSDINL